MTNKNNGLSKIHAKIARDVFPKGGVLKCRKCEYEQKFSTKQAGNYLKEGWPKHCGVGMRVVTNE